MGLRCLDELNGDFAFAILDMRVGSLFLAVIEPGSRPLYYSLGNDALLFGSEIKALVAAGWRPQLDKEGLQKFFVFKYTPGTETLFRGVKRLRRGTS